MSVSKLAEDARTLSRAIFASLPFGVRVGHVIAHVLRVAFQDELPSFGFALLSALYKAGFQGEVGNVTKFRIETLTPATLNSSKAMKPAMELAKRVYTAARVSSYDPTYIEAGMWKLQEKLLEHQVRLDPSNTVDQAVSYLGQALLGYVNDARKTEQRRQIIREDSLTNVYEDVLLGNPASVSKIPPRVWSAFLKQVERNPAYRRNSQNRNYVLLWLDEVSQGSNTGHGAVTEVARELGLSDVALKKDIEKNRDQIKKDFQIVLKHMTA